MSAAAAAVVEILDGRNPVMPPGLSMPDVMTAVLPDEDDDRAVWIQQQWGWLALTWWCRFKLSSGQRQALQRQHYDLNELGNDFFRYLISDEGATGGTVRPPASYILASAHPAAVLGEWFGRFVASASGPFERSVCWKLKRRFDDILCTDPRFSPVGDAWRLAERLSCPKFDPLVGDTGGVKGHLTVVVGSIQPFLYKAKVTPPNVGQGEETIEREDPLIRKEDAIRVAVAAIEYTGPMTSWELALACRELLPEVLWCEIMRKVDGEGDRGGTSQDSPDENDRDSRSPETADPQEEGDGELLSYDGFRELAFVAWKKLTPAQRIVTAARLFHDPPWTLQQIQDWTVTHLLPEFQMKLQRVHDRAGRDDVRIKAEIRAITPEWLFEDCRRENLRAFLAEMATEARKTLAAPPSNWVRQSQERKSPAHE